MFLLFFVFLFHFFLWCSCSSSFSFFMFCVLFLWNITFCGVLVPLLSSFLCSVFCFNGTLLFVGSLFLFFQVFYVLFFVLMEHYFLWGSCSSSFKFSMFCFLCYWNITICYKKQNIENLKEEEQEPHKK
jgi:hypothetical protein